jgi:hypothetical protein
MFAPPSSSTRMPSFGGKEGTFNSAMDLTDAQREQVARGAGGFFQRMRQMKRPPVQSPMRRRPQFPRMVTNG